MVAYWSSGGESKERVGGWVRVCRGKESIFERRERRRERVRYLKRSSSVWRRMRGKEEEGVVVVRVSMWVIWERGVCFSLGIGERGCVGGGGGRNGCTD